MKIQKFLEAFYQSARNTVERFFKKENSGSILVEFIASIPVLLLIIYASIDLTKYYLTRFKLENASRYAANMLIHSIGVSDSDGTISAEKFKYIAHAAFYNIYVGNQNMTNKPPLGHNSIFSVYFVEDSQVTFCKSSATVGDSPQNREITDTPPFTNVSGLDAQGSEYSIIVEAGIVKTSGNPKNVLKFFVLPTPGTFAFMGGALVLPTPLQSLAFSDSEQTIEQLPEE